VTGVEPKSPKTPRQVEIADHLWEVFERLAGALGSGRDALINEAMHLFARQHGYVAPAIAPESSRQEVAERVLGTADRLEQAMRSGTDAVPATGDGAERSLYLLTEGGDLGEVTVGRFIIGRGRHCHMVIDSPKVSREHAAIVRDGEEFFIEDLGSANGTWFQKERIERRRIADGDEYFICAERIRCVIR
jgi:hypothetical protein